MTELVALNKKRQSKFAKKVSKVKTKVQKGEIQLETPLRKPLKSDRGLVYIGHIPHGFYENEMKLYFSQFGDVTNVRVCRSFKTGKTKGYGFVEFQHPEVAQVAADTMHNYLMFKRRLEAKYIPPEKQRKGLFRGKAWDVHQTPYKKAIKQATRQRNTDVSGDKYTKTVNRQLLKLQKGMKKLADLGIDHKFLPADVPAGIEATKQVDSDDSIDEEMGKKIMNVSIEEVKVKKNKNRTLGPIKQNKKLLSKKPTDVSVKEIKKNKSMTRSGATMKFKVEKVKVKSKKPKSN